MPAELSDSTPNLMRAPETLPGHSIVNTLLAISSWLHRMGDRLFEIAVDVYLWLRNRHLMYLSYLPTTVDGSRLPPTDP